MSNTYIRFKYLSQEHENNTIKWCDLVTFYLVIRYVRSFYFLKIAFEMNY